MPLNKKNCPQNKYSRFHIHKFAQTEKSPLQQNLPLNQRFKISTNWKLPLKNNIFHTNLPLTEKYAPKYKNLPAKYPKLVSYFFSWLSIIHIFLVPSPSPPPPEMFRGETKKISRYTWIICLLTSPYCWMSSCAPVIQVYTFSGINPGLDELKFERRLPKN